MSRSRPGALSLASVALVVMLSFLAAPTRAQAQSHAVTVWNQLDEVFKKLKSDDYSSRNYIIGTIDEDESDSWTITLFEGREYRFVGVCDGDCSDLDFSLLDENSKEIASDVADDDVPIVTVKPTKTTRYTIKATMAKCKDEPCYYGIGIFFK